MKLLSLVSRAVCLIGFGIASTNLAVAQSAQEEVTYLLPAPATLPAFAPWMIAQHKGYYAQENLKVNFVAARGGVDVAKQIGSGNAIIGGAIGDTPIIVRANDVPVKAVAVLGQGSLSLFAVHDDSSFNSLSDLAGKNVSTISYADTTFYAFLGGLKEVGLTKNQVEIQAAGPAGVWQLFASRKFDAMIAVPDWIVNAEEAGAKVRLLPSPGNFRSMAQAILASDDVIQKNPELIGKLVRATLRGMQDIMQDPKAAAAIYVEAVPSYKGKEAMIERVFGLYNEHVYAGQAPIGKIDEKRLDALQKFYVSEGIVQKGSKLNDLFTNQFIGGGQ